LVAVKGSIGSQLPSGNNCPSWTSAETRSSPSSSTQAARLLGPRYLFFTTLSSGVRYSVSTSLLAFIVSQRTSVLIENVSPSTSMLNVRWAFRPPSYASFETNRLGSGITRFTTLVLALALPPLPLVMGLVFPPFL